ncbi:MAG TPA: hypothetical protein VIR58_14840, partial [Acidimicrobiales bacterium]
TFRLRAGNPMMSEIEAMEGMPAEIAALSARMEVGVLAACALCGDELDVVDLAGEPLDIVGRMLEAEVAVMRAAATIGRIRDAAADVSAWLDVPDGELGSGDEDPLMDLYFVVDELLTVEPER